MKNILYISYDGMTDPLGQSQVLPYLTGISKNGYRFTIISFEKEEKFNVNRNLIEMICTEAGIKWVPLMYTKRPPIFSTIWDYIRMIRKAEQLNKDYNFEMVHCRSYIAALAGISLKKKFGIKFLFDMRGFWADERVDGKLWNLKNPVYSSVFKFFKSKEREFLSLADAVISLTHTAKSEMMKWGIKNLTDQKVKVIPCAADFNFFALTSPEKREKSKLENGFKKDDFVLSYIGSIGTWYMLNEMALFFNLLKKKCKEAKFFILTPDNPADVEDVLVRYSINPADVKIQYAQRKELPGLAYASDYNIFFIKQAYSKTASSPTKLGEMLAMGIPIVCNSGVGDVKNIIEETGAGICIDNFEEQTLLSAVNHILNYKNHNPEEIRDKAKKIYDLDWGVNSYLEVYTQILQSEKNQTATPNRE